MWETTIDGRVLHFRLAGINNQNFIMRDEETGSWWQQVSGEAIQGPLKGRKLRQVDHDELDLALCLQEQPSGRVLRPDQKIVERKRYAPADWEARMKKAPVLSLPYDPRLPARELVVGLTLQGRSKAYPLEALQRQSPVIDTLAGIPIVLVVGGDGRSVRAFRRDVEGRTLEFFAPPSGGEVALVDAETGSEWSFAGVAKKGPLMNTGLQKVPVLIDYWFDWTTYHPGTALYSLGKR